MSNLVSGLLIAQKYKLDRVLATGGMGSVWTAENVQLKVPVAIKFMAPALIGSRELVGRFEREATAAARLRSPNVVQVFDHGVDRGFPFIVMELLEGEDLGARLKREGRLSIPATARIVSDVCKALRRVHAMGIVHRDLKPANIFLARDDDDEVAKVLDFGVAKCLAEAASASMTRTGQLVGTPPYMSPEQVQCKKTIDHRSDLWSLGIIAFRALTGSLPFRNEAVVDIIVRIFSEPAPPPSSIAPDLPPEVDRFFARALAIAPEARFQTAREMADAMEALVSLPASSSAVQGVSLPAVAHPAEERREAAPASEPTLGVLETADPATEGAEDPFDVARTVPLIGPAAPLWRPPAPPSQPAVQERIVAAPAPVPAPSGLVRVHPQVAPAPPALQRSAPPAPDLPVWVAWLSAAAGLLVVVVVLFTLLTR